MCACSCIKTRSCLPLMAARACRRWYRCHVDLSGFLPPPAAAAPGGICSSGSASSSDSGGSIVCIPNASQLSSEEFEARFDGPGQPALLRGLAAGWAGGWSMADGLFGMAAPGRRSCGGACLLHVRCGAAAAHAAAAPAVAARCRPPRRGLVLLPLARTVQAATWRRGSRMRWRRAAAMRSSASPNLSSREVGPIDVLCPAVQAASRAQQAAAA